MPPSHIFLSTRSRREYQRRRPSALVLPVRMLLAAVVVLAWMLAAWALWAGL